MADALVGGAQIGVMMEGAEFLLDRVPGHDGPRLSQEPWRQSRSLTHLLGADAEHAQWPSQCQLPLRT